MSSNTQTILIIVLSVSTLSLLIYLLMNQLSNTSGQYLQIQTNNPTNRILGGCAGTRWGCCPDGYSARNDPFGTNC
jgi:hypothetical protein